MESWGRPSLKIIYKKKIEKLKMTFRELYSVGYGYAFSLFKKTEKVPFEIR
jgi:hypothetical protein